MGKNPILWIVYSEATLGFDLRMLYWEMIRHPLERLWTFFSPWVLAFFTLDVEHVDDDVMCYDDLRMLGLTYH
jgi:hypothetical protein